jgi:hypothetical protein
MIKKILPFLLLVNIFLCAAAPAQTTDSGLQISSMEIDIWPEYDQPSVLVIYRISFDSLTNFPSTVNFTIPASAGNPSSVAMKDVDGLLYDLEYSVTPDGSWNRIRFITSSPDIQIEFYDPYIESAPDLRTYSYRWISDYAINDLKLVVQQPRFVSNIDISPDYGTGKINPDDHLKYFTLDLGSLKRGAYVNTGISYIKSDDSLSASTQPVKAVDTIQQESGVTVKLKNLVDAIWENTTLTTAAVLILISFALIVLVALLALQKRDLKDPDANPPRENMQKKRTVNASEVREVYCHVCGKRARPGDLYCRTCGSKLIQR